MVSKMIVQDQHALEHEAHVAGVILAALNRMCDRGDLDPFTPYIVAQTSRLAQLQAAVLAITGIRFSELTQIDMVSLLAGVAQTILQPKTGRRRAIVLPDYVLDLTQAVAWEPVSLSRVSYDSLRYDLAQHVPSEVREALKGHADLTHVFRHLRASWMLLQGRSLAEIAEALGHFSEDSNYAYLHGPELFA